MIEYELVDYLLTDSSLKTLLGWAADDPKIYPVQAGPDVSTPYIIYEWDIGDPTDELLHEDRITLTIVDTDLSNADDIRKRLIALLDLQDDIQATVFYSDSPDYYMYWSKFTSGRQLVVPDTEEHNVICIFDIKFKSK